MARKPGSSSLSHIGPGGEARMVDVSVKDVTLRQAVATGRVTMAAATVREVRLSGGPKGDVIQVARLAGIMAAKRTATLIPLCHPLPITGIEVDITPRRDGFAIKSTVRTSAQTGVEMEALTAVAVAALTVYDMVKAIDKGVAITDIQLLEKRGGKSGLWKRGS